MEEPLLLPPVLILFALTYLERVATGRMPVQAAAVVVVLTGQSLANRATCSLSTQHQAQFSKKAQPLTYLPTMAVMQLPQQAEPAALLARLAVGWVLPAPAPLLAVVVANKLMARAGRLVRLLARAGLGMAPVQAAAVAGAELAQILAAAVLA